MLEYISNPPLHGAALSFLVSAFSNVYNKKSLEKTFSEGIVCTCVTLGLVGSVEYFNFPKSLSPGLGVYVGLLGLEKIKLLVDNLFDMKIKEKISSRGL
ncbi:phage holin family protein [Enterobacter kobei]|nr:phage holin family protein [Enterobacter kobei]